MEKCLNYLQKCEVSRFFFFKNDLSLSDWGAHLHGWEKLFIIMLTANQRRDYKVLLGEGLFKRDILEKHIRNVCVGFSGEL